MDETVQLRTYTVADLRQWLLFNKAAEGLSESVIAPTRAFAIINNPFVKDYMSVVCALFVNNHLAAFTACFPEVLEKPNNQHAWWFTTLWCDPKYEGRGYGLIVVGTLCEAIGENTYFDSDGAQETVEIFKMLGLQTLYFPRFVFSRKKIKTRSLRGKCAWLIEHSRIGVCNLRRKKIKKEIAGIQYSVNYSKFVDEESFLFMKRHLGSDLILRKREMFDWILQYPFIQTSPLSDRVSLDNVFTSKSQYYQSLLLKVFERDVLIGVALTVFHNQEMSIKYLYFDEEKKTIVFDALIEQLLTFDATHVETNSSQLAERIKLMKLFTKTEISQRSFSIPSVFPSDSVFTLQAGDGDMFV
jgi:hypothetical protein